LGYGHSPSSFISSEVLGGKRDISAVRPDYLTTLQCTSSPELILPPYYGYVQICPAF